MFRYERKTVRDKDANRARLWLTDRDAYLFRLCDRGRGRESDQPQESSTAGAQ